MNDSAAAPAIDFEFAAVSPSLAPALLIYWEVRSTVETPIIDQMHPDWANIRFKLSGDWSYGASPAKMIKVDQFATITGPTNYGQWAEVRQGSGFNVTLLPTAWLRLFDKSASQFTNRILPLSALLGDQADLIANDIAQATTFAERVGVADAFFGRLWQKTRPYARAPQVEAISLGLLDPNCGTVEELMRRTGMAQHSLMRLVKRGYGMSPKILMRRERFLRMLRTMEVRSLHEWRDFLDPQYVDQSHMIKDFNYFLGLSPGQYFKLPRPMLESSLLAMQKLWASGTDHLHSAPKPEG